jgi:hypothetical protein
MMNDKTGGPAFPQPEYDYDKYQESLVLVARGGLTMLDYFAAAALTGLLAKHGLESSIEGLVDCTYRIASAMLKAREEVK